MKQNTWLEELSYNPINSLININNPSIGYFTRRDLLDEKVPEVNCLWELNVPKRLIKNQQEDGSWKYPGGQ
ncbi:MAG: hypothetical protein WCE60_05455, partial [Methanobacterium sp.]